MAYIDMSALHNQMYEWFQSEEGQRFIKEVSEEKQRMIDAERVGFETDAAFIDDWTRWVRAEAALHPPEPQEVKIMARAYATYEEHQQAVKEWAERNGYDAR